VLTRLLDVAAGAPTVLVLATAGRVAPFALLAGVLLASGIVRAFLAVVWQGSRT
jgi:hypothetical protein